MSTSVVQEVAPVHRVIPETRRKAVKADLRNAETDAGERARVGAAIERTMHLAGLNLDQFASLVGRDARQVRRWMDGSERPQFDRLFAIPALRQPLVIALAEMAEQDVVIDTVITVRRRVA